MQDTFNKVKSALLGYVESTFEEMEESAALRHQERFALLEDAFESATDVDEIRVAFEQWHSDHAEDLEFDQDVDEMWDAAIGGLLDDEYNDEPVASSSRRKTDNDEDDLYEEEEEEEEFGFGDDTEEEKY